MSAGASKGDSRRRGRIVGRLMLAKEQLYRSRMPLGRRHFWRWRMDDVGTKTQFAALAGATPGRVSQWLADGKISPEALVGRGHRARIRVTVALGQLRRNSGRGARASANANGKSRKACPPLRTVR